MAYNTEALDFILSARDNATSVFRTVDGGLNQLEKSFGRLAKIATGGLIGGEIFREMISEASKAEEASNRLNAVLKATGFAGGHTKDELDDMANSLAELTQFEDEAVRGAEATLLKFGNIHNDTFREALKLSADYAAFVGGDMASAAQTVGKALQSPEEGLKALEREMGKLSPTQKEAIKHFMDMNDLGAAQGIILDFLRGKIAGTAEVMNKGYLGATTGLSKAWGEMLESLGRSPVVMGPVQAGMGAIELLLQGTKIDLDLVTEAYWKYNEALNGALGIKWTRPGADGNAKDQARRGAQEAAWKDAMERQGVEQGKFAKKLDTEEAERQKKAHDEYLARENRLQELSVKGWIALAEARVNADFAEAEQIAKIQMDENAAEEKQQKDDEAKQIAHIDKMMELEREAGLAANDGLSYLQEQQKEAAKVDEFAKQMGMTFTSAFEDAALKGKNFSDVLKGIEQDIARIILRQGITNPLGSAITDAVKGSGVGDWFKGIFGGNRAEGGPIEAGKWYIAGEHGPEPIWGGGPGAYATGYGGGGAGPVNLNVTMNIQALDSRSVAQAIAPLGKQIAGMVSQVMNDRGRAGVSGR